MERDGSLYNKEFFLDKYEKVKHDGKNVLGEGGNAIVFPVKSRINEGDIVALKHLKILKKETTARFVAEIDSVLKNVDIEGVMPILDYDKMNYWYTMPLAEEVMCYVERENLSCQQIVQQIVLLSCTLVELHKRGYSHRDIKPQNIYNYNGRFCLGDFGLVDFPDNPHGFTKHDKGIGAIFTIAPEMKRDPLGQDGEKADVFSLAKTLWMLLARDNKGFDGQYDYTNPSHALRLRPEFSSVHLAEIEVLLREATSHNPESRPSMEELAQRLYSYLKIAEDWHKSGISDWRFLNQLLFKAPQVDSCCWRKREAIVEVLKQIVLLPTDNHTLFSSQGGYDLKHVNVATEEGCIELQLGPQTFIVKPKVLYYETFPVPSWNYMLLEADELKPIIGPMVDNMERLVEDIPGHYVNADSYNYGVYSYDGGEKLPDSARLVYRMSCEKLMIVLKCGTYNAIPETYDGRHGTMTHDELREYVESIISVIKNPNATKNDFEKVVKSKEKPLLLKPISSSTTPDTSYFDSKLSTWNFSDCIGDVSSESTKLLFTINVTRTEVKIWDDLETQFLLEDGTVGVISEVKRPATFSNRSEVMLCVERLNGKVKELVLDDGYEDIDPFATIIFIPHLQKNGMPSHLFTKEEIAILMREADDRGSNILVIDEEGYAQILQSEYNVKTYPVSLKRWHPRDNIVGRYSSLSELDSIYKDCLYYWLNYLRTGERQFAHYYNSRLINTESLVRDILFQYKAL